MTGDWRWRGWDDVRDGYEDGADALKHAIYFLIFVVNAFRIGLKTAIENKVGMLQWDTFLMMGCTN